MVEGDYLKTKECLLSFITLHTYYIMIYVTYIYWYSATDDADMMLLLVAAKVWMIMTVMRIILCVIWQILYIIIMVRIYIPSLMLFLTLKNIIDVIFAIHMHKRIYYDVMEWNAERGKRLLYKYRLTLYW